MNPFRPAYQATIQELIMPSALPNAIAELSSLEASVRERAAAELYQSGRSKAERAIAAWWSDEELSRLLLAQKRELTVGLAVLRETFAKIRTANGVPRLAEVPSDQDAEEFELHFSSGVSLDILTSRAPGGDGAIARYLEKFGEGVQQVEFRTLDVEKSTQILKEKFKISAIHSEARAGADGTKVNFFLVPVPDAGKVLIELYQSSGKTEKG
jgi:hypothetical protein